MKALTYGTVRLLYAAYLVAIFVTLAVLDVYLLVDVLATSVVFAVGEHFIEQHRLQRRRLATALELEGDATIGTGRSSLSRRD